MSIPTETGFRSAGSVEVLDRFDASPLIGLRVTVIGAALSIIDEDGDEEIEVPHLDDLAVASAMARALLPERLRGREIKAIRGIMGLTLKELAQRLGEQTAPETVSRWESETQPMGGYAEKVLRLLICEELKDRAQGVAYDASVISDLRQIDPWRVNPDYELEPMEFRMVKAMHDRQEPIDAWNTPIKRAA